MDFTVKAILLISVLIACATAPINMLVDFLFQDIISAPSADEYKVELQSRQSRQRFGRRLATVAANMRASVRNSISVASSAIAPILPLANLRTASPKSLFSRISSRVIEHFTVKDASIRMMPPNVVQSYALTSLVLKDVFDKETTNSAHSETRDKPSGVPRTLVVDSTTDENRLSLYDTVERGEMSDRHFICYDDFYAKLYTQNRQLSGVEQIEFQERWGFDAKYDSLDSHSNIFGSDQEAPSSIAAKIMKNLPCFRSNTTRRMVLTEAIEETCHISNEKMNKLKVASDMHVGLEIMHLFIIDLLGKNTSAAIIFDSMTQEDFRHSIVVTRTAKRSAWILVIFLNIYFVYFSVLRGITRSTSWQMDYMLACIFQLFVEILVYETGECLWIHLTIPKLVREDVCTTMNTVRHAIDLAFESDKVSPVLDSPKYFFASRHLAEEYPALFESSIVLAFQSFFPPSDLDTTSAAPPESDRDMDGGQSRLWAAPYSHDVQVRRQKKKTVFLAFVERFNFSVVLLATLQHLGTVPIRIQQVIIHTLQPILFSFVIILYFYLLKYPVMALIPMAFILYEMSMYVYRKNGAPKPIPAINDPAKNTSGLDKDRDRDKDKDKDKELIVKISTSNRPQGLHSAKITPATDEGVDSSPPHSHDKNYSHCGMVQPLEEDQVPDISNAEKNQNDLLEKESKVSDCRPSEEVKRAGDDDNNDDEEELKFDKDDALDNGDVSGDGDSDSDSSDSYHERNIEKRMQQFAFTPGDNDSSDSSDDRSVSSDEYYGGKITRFMNQFANLRADIMNNINNSSDSSDGAEDDDDHAEARYSYLNHLSATEKELFLLQRDVNQAENAMQQCLINNGVNTPEDFIFDWDENSDEYRYFYQHPIAPFVNTLGENVNLYQIISKRNALMVKDYTAFQRKQGLARKDVIRKKQFTSDWDTFRLYDSDLILPFVDQTRNKHLTREEIYEARELRGKKEKTVHEENTADVVVVAIADKKTDDNDHGVVLQELEALLSPLQSKEDRNRFTNICHSHDEAFQQELLQLKNKKQVAEHKLMVFKEEQKV